MTSVDHVDRCDQPPGRHGEAVVAQHRLGDALVHADGRRQHAGADVGHARAPRGGPAGRRPHRRARAARGTRLRPAAGRRRGGRAPASGCLVHEVVGRGERLDVGHVGEDSVARRPTACRGSARSAVTVTRRRRARWPRCGAPRCTTPRARPTGPRRRPPTLPGSGIDRGYTIDRERDACDSPLLNSQPGSVGSRSDPTSPSTGASIDTRTSAPGQLYVPIVAERDGHEFIGAALERGPPAYLTAARSPSGPRPIVVEDTAAALLQPGRAGPRAGWHGGVVGITGSVGKTTTKDLLRHCLASTFRDRSQRAVLQQRARPPAHAAQRAGRRPVGRPRDGRPWRRATSRGWPRWAGPTSAS